MVGGVCCDDAVGDKSVGVVVAVDTAAVMAGADGVVVGDEAVEDCGAAVVKCADSGAVAACCDVIGDGAIDYEGVAVVLGVDCASAA